MILLNCRKFDFKSATSSFAEVVNELKLVVDRAPKPEQLRYQRARAKQALYKAAAKLWTNGVPISKAIEIVEEAMKISGEL